MTPVTAGADGWVRPNTKWGAWYKLLLEDSYTVVGKSKKGIVIKCPRPGHNFVVEFENG